MNRDSGRRKEAGGRLLLPAAGGQGRFHTGKQSTAGGCRQGATPPTVNWDTFFPGPPPCTPPVSVSHYQGPPPPCDAPGSHYAAADIIHVDTRGGGGSISATEKSGLFNV